VGEGHVNQSGSQLAGISAGYLLNVNLTYLDVNPLNWEKKRIQFRLVGEIQDIK
jgi:hypothetical protein